MYFLHRYRKASILAIMFVVALATGTPCFAVLGDSELDLGIRYGRGEPFQADGGKWADKLLLFSEAIAGPDRGTIDVIAYIVNGKCVAETYVFRDANGEPAVIDGEVYAAAKKIVEGNSQGHSWRGRPGLPPRGISILWVRSDDPGSTAVVWENSQHSLEVFSAEGNAIMESRLSGAGRR